MKLSSGCGHTAPPMGVDGVLVCGRCGAPYVAAAGVAAEEVSSVRLPTDAKDSDLFNRACRRGDVVGARKVGRVWVCTRAAWEARAKVKPEIPPEARAKVAKARPGPIEPSPIEGVSADTLAALGLQAKRRAS